MKKVVSLLVAMFLIASLFVAFAEVPVEVLDNPYLVLVNKENKLPDNWTDMLQFGVGKNSLGELYIVETEAFAKIHQHLAEFGFILRYLPKKEDITGYSYEPWHFRYISNPALAQSIMTAKITFEEYHNLLQSTFN